MDAAYGGGALLTERGRGWLRGIELAIPGGLVPELARRIPRVGERLRAAARERLPSV